MKKRKRVPIFKTDNTIHYNIGSVAVPKSYCYNTGSMTEKWQLRAWILL